jgi:prevent-host-death family protein
MREREVMTQTMKASDVRQQWSQILNRVFRKETRVVVEKSGIPVAAIVSAEDLAWLQELDTRRDELFRAIDETQATFADVPEEELEREIRKAIAEGLSKHNFPFR